MVKVNVLNLDNSAISATTIISETSGIFENIEIIKVSDVSPEFVAIYEEIGAFQSIPSHT